MGLLCLPDAETIALFDLPETFWTKEAIMAKQFLTRTMGIRRMRICCLLMLCFFFLLFVFLELGNPYLLKSNFNILCRIID